MYTTENEGLLNNCAVELELYSVVYPSLEQQQRYTFQGAIAFIFVMLAIFTAFSVG